MDCIGPRQLLLPLQGLLAPDTMSTKGHEPLLVVVEPVTVAVSQIPVSSPSFFEHVVMG